ncbi:MAG: Ger(x)C family spore germination protein [Enterococcus thailandicus]|nr:Ger(x)C family spore germination protein [Enterococcus thailandicus]
MRRRAKRNLLIWVLLPSLFLSGCWDKREIESLFIVTAVGLDTAKEEGELAVTFQISKSKASSTGNKEGSGDESSAILLKSESKTIQEALGEQNRNSSRSLLLQHNQVILLGTELAEQGVEEKLDLFLRNQQARVEVLVLVADGKAGEVLGAKIGQESTPGLYLSHMMRDMRRMSPHYNERLLDFISSLRDGTSGPVAPIVKVKKEEGKETLTVEGLAVFQRDKMVGRLDNPETMGYLWALGKVRQCEVAIESDQGRAAFTILKLETKRKTALRPDGGVKVALEVETVLRVGELQGFTETPLEELRPTLTALAEKQIKEQILGTAAHAKELGADIYGFGRALHAEHPKQWKELEGNWDKLFRDLELDVQVKVQIPEPGQIVKTLELGEARP